MKLLLKLVVLASMFMILVGRYIQSDATTITAIACAVLSLTIFVLGVDSHAKISN